MAGISSLKVLVKTGDIGKGGTDDNVWFDTGRHRWLLDNPGRDDFERGNLDSFTLPIPHNMQDSDIWRIAIFKAPDGAYGGWRLQGVTFLVNGAVYFDNQAINQWLEDEGKREWVGSLRPKGAPSSVLIAESRVKDQLDSAIGDFASHEKRLKRLGTAKVEIECPHIRVQQKFEAEVTGPNPDVTVKIKFVPFVTDAGAVSVRITSFSVHVDFPLWVDVATFGLINLLEDKIEDNLRSKLKSKVEEVIGDQVAQLGAFPIKHISLRPNAVELFY